MGKKSSKWRVDLVPTLTDNTFECVSYNEHCSKRKGECERRTQKCQQPAGTHDMRLACIAVWSNDTTNGVTVKMQACHLTQDKPPLLPTECREDECVATGPKVLGDFTSYLCCCHQPHCNKEFRLEPTPPVTKPNPSGNRTVSHSSGSNELASSLIYAFLPICLIALLIAFSYWAYRRFRLRRVLEKEAENGGFKSRTVRSSLPLKPIELKEIVARGRYGCIWKACLHRQQIVAVKVFPANDADSWVQEQEIYATPRLKEHPNVLTFFAAETRETEAGMEYWLITAFHERGSMYDFLKRNTLTISEALRLATSMLRGLTFLHEECLGTEETYKPTIVHRDFKSKNVLVKDDMTACIADFGLAVKCIHGRPPDDVNEQVGTRRYMAPEVLEGATEFSAFAFRQIDVYACGLVLWELFSRSSLAGEPVCEYRLPFEEEVSSAGGSGLRPSLQHLQTLVAVKKRRPVLKSMWYEHPQGSAICATIEEMWDAEAEARIGAGCAFERLSAVSASVDASLHSSSDSGIASDTAPLISDCNSNLTTTGSDRPAEQEQGKNFENV